MFVPKPAVAPLTPAWVTVQLYVAPATPLLVLNAIPVVAPLQSVWDAGVATTSGIGFTVTNTVTGVPAQPAAVGVIVYVAVPGMDPVVVNVSAIVEPLPTSAPLTPASCARPRRSDTRAPRSPEADRCRSSASRRHRASSRAA